MPLIALDLLAATGKFAGSLKRDAGMSFSSKIVQKAGPRRNSSTFPPFKGINHFPIFMVFWGPKLRDVER